MTQLSGKLLSSNPVTYIDIFIKGKKQCVLRDFQFLEEPGIVYNICENSTECCDASWKGVCEICRPLHSCSSYTGRL